MEHTPTVLLIGKIFLRSEYSDSKERHLIPSLNFTSSFFKLFKNKVTCSFLN